MTPEFQNALIIGAGRGTGRALAEKLAAAGLNVTAVARTQDDLDTLAAKNPGVSVIAGDGADGIASDLLDKVAPDLLVLAGGITPKMGSFHQQDWEDFSATWNADTKTTFDFLKAALMTPMKPEGTIVQCRSHPQMPLVTDFRRRGAARQRRHSLRMQILKGDQTYIVRNILVIALHQQDRDLKVSHCGMGIDYSPQCGRTLHCQRRQNSYLRHLHHPLAPKSSENFCW